MSFVINTLTYNRDAFVNPNKLTFTGPSHTYQVKDLFIEGRTAPKPSGSDPGVARASVKRTKSVLIGGVYKDIIIEVSCSVPVGSADADIDALRDDVADYLLSSNGTTLFKKGTFSA